MTDETKLLGMTEEELLGIVSTHSPTNILWTGAKAALEIKNARQMTDSTRRMEWATYVILFATIVYVALLIVQYFRR
jgi:hypothetical protein